MILKNIDGRGPFMHACICGVCSCWLVNGSSLALAFDFDGIES